MKLNKFGINIDEGLPLQGEALDKLYEPCFPDFSKEIENWIKDSLVSKPLLVGGQIGSGKTTLLNQLFKQKDLSPEIKIEFDKESLNLDEGDFLSIILARFLGKTDKLQLDINSLKLPYDYFNLKEKNLKDLIELLIPSVFSIETFENKRKARKVVSEHSEYFKNLIIKLGELIQEKLKSSFFIFASGIDKFNTKSSAFFELKSSLNILSQFKTLFEVNAVHLFLSDTTTPFKNITKKLLITTPSNKQIVNILEKRMGIYSQPVKNELELISKWSGGNPRQAIRILSYFLSFKKDSNLTKTEKLAKAIKETSEDFFAFANKPNLELIKSVEREKKIESSFINLPGDKETAQEAIYGNWIFITDGSQNSSWPATINPLIKSYFKDKETISESPEQILLKKYAETHGISASGLTFTTLDEEGAEKSPSKILFEFFSSGIEEPYPLKIIEILDLITASLLSKDRKDRILIAYKDKKILEASRAYIFAKANTYEYQRYEHRIITGGKNHNPLHQIEEILAIDTDIFSLDLEGDWSDVQLDILNKHRDIFINYQMIWWVSYEKIKKYLPHWVQLRELFEFFVIEDEMLGSLSKKDIEDDISFFEDLIEGENTAESETVKNLKVVLEFLKKEGGENG